MRRTLLRHVLPILVAGAGPASVSANTLSKAYDEAFANPKGFEYFLLEGQDSFFARFASCAKMADPILARLEANLRGQHRDCHENDECAAIAKQIGVVVEAKENVRMLATYVARWHSSKVQDFAESDAGKRSLSGFETLKKMGGFDDAQTTAFIRRIPAFQGVIASLEGVPCQ